jgi:type IV secretory pathway VirB10-like protein
MRSKPKNTNEEKTKKTTTTIEEDDIEVSEGGPSIVSANRNKIMIGVAVTVFVILSYLFLGEDGTKPTSNNITTETPQTNQAKEEVTNKPQPTQVAPSETGKSPFEFQEIDKKEKEENLDSMAKQAKPEIPDLPELPKEVANSESSQPNINNNLPKNLAPNIPQETTNKTQSMLELERKIKEQEAKIKEKEQKIEELEIKKEIEKIEEEEKKELAIPARYAPIVILGGGGGGPDKGFGYDKNIVSINKDPLSKLKKSETPIEATVIEDLPHTIAQGKIITAVLETAISTELPGGVRAIVSRDVFGEVGKEILIPRGSRLYGTYSTEIKFNQARVNINWTNLLRPDGVKLAVTLQAGDEFGRAGVVGEVDRRYSSIVANTVLTSAFALGTSMGIQKLFGGNGVNTTTITNLTSGTAATTAGASNQIAFEVTKNILDVMKGVVDQAIDIQPVIRLAQGTKITIMVTADLKLPSMKQK